ncbi:hypothetical protein Scep_020520 [Stephania cephalantha]|uniref:RRM domain-containing protein n=1 Tax=Stephania cephalantha TaxID=152367 RepID=A0AAP0ICS3_9MAGN
MVVKKVEEDNVKEVGDGENASEIESGLVNVENSSIDDANVEEEAAEGIVEEKGGEPPAEEKKDDAESVEYDGGEGERFQEPGDDECAEDDMSEPEEEIGRLEDEQMELSAHAKERKIKKEQEVFVGGLDRDAVEDDIKKAFEKIGEVIDIRLHKNPVTNKNKGYAFVRFASKEQASRALAELKTPIIRGKRCGLAPSEDNDTLFIGNICNTWTKEAIKQKLKEYGLDGVENVTLVPDAQHDGLSRGFAFVEFSCHNDAMLAYKRLQKPDAIFGHAERSVKVAFAEPLREPDPEVMAQVKSVFVDGLPPQWDEERVREYFKQYGEIERIVLARNMPSAKRKDFGFVDYNTHDAAVACINGLNNTELGDERSKTRVRVRLSNPLPKTQAVKGGLCGGFRVGRGGSGTGFPRFGRGFGRGGYANRGSFPRGTDFHGRGRGRTGRFAFAGDSYQEGSYSGFHGRQPFGGRGLRMGYDEEMVHPDFGRSRHVVERGRGRSFQPRRPQFQYESHYNQPVGGRYLADDPYLYDDVGHGMKRPYSMMDHEQPGYLEPNRLRPRFDHPDPAFPPRETHYQDSYGAGGSGYSRDYYSSSYGGSSFSSTYGPDRPYGSGGYYY